MVICHTNRYKQGCQTGLSCVALLFVLAIEMRGIKIRQQTNLKGFDLGLPHYKVRILQYAGDCVLCFNDKHELCTVLSIINNFTT